MYTHTLKHALTHARIHSQAHTSVYSGYIYGCSLDKALKPQRDATGSEGMPLGTVKNCFKMVLYQVYV